ncbi:hypothetical protein Dsin_030506 [Dipteronia sinensis]|uniref:Reverse transcriptase zinc-binding domain-containing protein n=1 Tax=Dipteronia sinensis TaxID=43782 RepID=A0AAD9ZJS5_9ROSI|nr:hypothetical protein Dsin_030506 [Dipteronia sinensis]
MSLNIKESTSEMRKTGFDWKSIWNLNLPTKIKIFLWRSLREWLPTQVNLARRNILVGGLCSVCCNSLETAVHALWGCSRLKKVWNRYDLLRGVNFASSLCFQDFFSSCTQNLGKKDLKLLCVVLWHVWFLRNQLVQCVGRHGLKNVVPWSEEFLEESMVVNGVVGIQREQVRQNEIKWHPPEVGFFKLNTDAAIDVQKWCVGLGMVVRDCFGAVKAGSIQRIEARYSASVAEALAILRGISFAIYCGYDHLIIESDALGVVNMINLGTEISADIGVIIEDIRCLLQNIPDARVRYVSIRKANVVANSLSKLALTLDVSYFWLNSFPPAVERCVQDDCPS